MSTVGSFAPIVLFAYARLDHLRQTVKSLQANSEAGTTPLYVFCDGPKHEMHKEQIEAVRAYVDVIDGFESVTRIYRDQNLGLAESVIRGVGQVVARYGRVIVMEDDLVVSPHFLAYMNRGLDLYNDDLRVASIHGYTYPLEEDLPESFFLRGADCWGWATWARTWQYFEPDGQKLLDQLHESGLTRSFDFDGAYSYSGMLKNQIRGRNDSWAVRWHASCFIRNLLTLYPGNSLVNNIGNDGSGTHSSPSKEFDQNISDIRFELQKIPCEESSFARKSFIKYFRTRHSLSTRIRRKLVALAKELTRV